MRTALPFALVLLLATPVQAGAIAGSVRVTSKLPDHATFRPYAGRASSLPAPVRPPRGQVTDAVIYVEELPAGAEVAVPTATPTLAQRGQAFEPRVVVVPVGGTVSFPNFDPIYHNVFSVSPVKRFDLGKYGKGGSRSVTFTKPGVVNVFCDIHSDMSASILVVPKRAWARPAADGRYSLAGLPPGRYTLHWWHPDFTAGHTTVEVPASGAVSQDVEL
jgi:plastocyanin